MGGETEHLAPGGPDGVRTRSEVTGYLGYLLRAIRILAAQRFAASKAAPGADGLSDRSRLKEMAVLLLLGQDGPASQQELGDRLAINRSMMVKVIDELERNGLALRAMDPRDRRRHAVTITAAGAERAAALLGWAHAVEAEIVATLAPTRRSRLLELLGALSAAHRPALPPPLGSALLWLVTALDHDLEELADHELAPLGLTTRSFVALALVAGACGAQSDLGAALAIGPAATVELVDQLERAGLARRVRSIEDRRQSRVELTERGESSLCLARPVLEATADRFASHLGERGREELLELLGHLAEAIEPPRCRERQERSFSPPSECR